MSWLLPLCLLAFVHLYQATTGCKKCTILAKKEKEMFSAHSHACLAQSQVDPKLIDSLLNGELTDDPSLRKHIYCILLKCKVIGKDGQLHKSVMSGKTAARADGKNITKIFEACAKQTIGDSDSPEDVAWNFFRCGFDKRVLLFNYMPISHEWP